MAVSNSSGIPVANQVCRLFASHYRQVPSISFLFSPHPYFSVAVDVPLLPSFVFRDYSRGIVRDSLLPLQPGHPDAADPPVAPPPGLYRPVGRPPQICPLPRGHDKLSSSPGLCPVAFWSPVLIQRLSKSVRSEWMGHYAVLLSCALLALCCQVALRRKFQLGNEVLS